MIEKPTTEDLARHLSFFVPPGFSLMAQAEIARILNESEALRIERDQARAEAERLRADFDARYHGRPNR